MRILVLDPRNGAATTGLLSLDLDGRVVARAELGYVPELCHDARRDEIVTVETDLDPAPARYWMRRYTAATLSKVAEVETEERPMYAGFPGRSTRVVVGPTGRYVYGLESRMTLRHPDADDVLGARVVRWDLERGALERSELSVDSCTLAFGHAGPVEGELFFHLSCDFPSTVVFGRFDAPGLRVARLDDLPGRVHSPRETCATSCDPARGLVWAATGSGRLYEVDAATGSTRVLLDLPLPAGASVPLHHLCHAHGVLLIGLARDDGERSLGLSSSLLEVALDGARATVAGEIPLPFPVMSFAVCGVGSAGASGGDLLAGADPYSGSVFWMDRRTRRVLRVVEELGVSPGEVLVLPAG